MAAMVECVAIAEETAAWAADGHWTSTSWLEAVTGTARHTSLGRTRCARFRSLGLLLWAEAIEAATIGVEQSVLLGSIAADRRVQLHPHDSEALLLDLARSLPYRTFARAVDHRVRLADPDGSIRAHERADDGRGLSMTTLGERFVLRAECGTVQGAVIEQLLGRSVERELRGDLATIDDATHPLPRSGRQRALDALVAALEHAASSDANSVEPVVNLMYDASTMLEWVRWGIGGRHPAPDPTTVEHRQDRADRSAVPSLPRGRRAPA